MKYLPIACFLVASTPFAVEAAGVDEVKTVYLLPMSRGLDQYLAERLTGQGLFQIVTDPRKADAIFTDRIGANFEESLTQLFQTPEQIKAAEKEKAEEYTRPTMQPLARGKGNIYLVDRGSHTVLWSTFLPPKNSDSKELNRVANEIASRLAKTRQKK